QGPLPRFLVAEDARMAHPGTVHQDVDRAERCGDLRDHAAHARVVRDVQRPRAQLAARRAHFVREALQAGLADVGRRDTRALGGEESRGGAPDAARGARDERALAADRSTVVHARPSMRRLRTGSGPYANSALTSSPTERSISGSSVSELVTATVHARRG